MSDLLLRLILFASFTLLGIAGLLLWFRGPVPAVGVALLATAIVDLVLLVVASDG
ncbi:MAG: hypothetical protein L0Z62_14420 [Gemmataceae bacterium]|nr:hypothetical protein [Gemmataceae bacterium]